MDVIGSYGNYIYESCSTAYNNAYDSAAESYETWKYWLYQRIMVWYFNGRYEMQKLIAY